MAAKHYKILIPNSVKVALQQQASYITIEQGEPLIASKWLDGIIKAIQSLSNFPNRCPIAPENSYISKSRTTVIRHLIYKKSFRIIFTIVKNEVRILSAKHSARFS